MDTIIKTKSKRTAKTALAKPEKNMSKKEKNILNLLKEAQAIAKKYKMKSFNRKEIYGNL